MTTYDLESPKKATLPTASGGTPAAPSSAAQSGTQLSHERRQEMIAVNAYFRAESRGFRNGDPLVDWLDAERDIDQLLHSPRWSVPPAGEQSKAAFQARYEAQLNEWDRNLAELKASARRLGKDLRAEYERQVQLLATKRADAEERLAELRLRTEGAWQDLKTGAEKSWDEMRKALDSVASRFK